MQFREVPSLSRLMDKHLNHEVVPGKMTTFDYMQSITVSIPTENYEKLLGDEVETLYLRPMVKALGEKINSFGPVRAAELPIPKGEVAWNCTNGRIPVLLRIVRRVNPDRYQILLHALVEPVNLHSDCEKCQSHCEGNCKGKKEE
jgi:hypothetical protein